MQGLSRTIDSPVRKQVHVFFGLVGHLISVIPQPRMSDMHRLVFIRLGLKK